MDNPGDEEEEVAFQALFTGCYPSTGRGRTQGQTSVRRRTWRHGYFGTHAMFQAWENSEGDLANMLSHSRERERPY